MDKNYLIQLTKDVYRLTLFFPKKEPLRYKIRELADQILVNSLIIINSYKQEFSRKKRIELLPDSRENNFFLELESLESFFEVIKEQNWVKPTDVSELQKKYLDLGKELKKIEKESFSSETLSSLIPSMVDQRLLMPKINEINNNFVEVQQQNNEKVIFETSKTEPPQTKTIGNFTYLSPKLSERQKKILEFLKKETKAQVWQIKQIFPELTKRTLRRDFHNLLKTGLVERIGEKNNTFYRLKY